MKTKMKQLSTGAILGLLLLVGNVNAKGTEVKASGHENNETSLTLENWMIDDNIWNKKAESIVWFEEAIDEKIEIENWMTSNNTWEEKTSIGFKTETEKKLQLETWMFRTFNRNHFKR